MKALQDQQSFSSLQAIMTNPRDVKYANQSIARWQDALKQRGFLATNNIAFACLRGVLHELRARLTVEEVAQFGNHLPAVQRGVFYQDWEPLVSLPTPDLAEFEEALARRLLPHIHMPEAITADVLWVMKTESDPSDGRELRKVLPGALRERWDTV